MSCANSHGCWAGWTRPQPPRRGLVTASWTAWPPRAREHARLAELTRDPASSQYAEADAVLAVGLARAAVAQAVLAVWRAQRSGADVPAARHHVLAGLGARVRTLA